MYTNTHTPSLNLYRRYRPGLKFMYFNSFLLNRFIFFDFSIGTDYLPCLARILKHFCNNIVLELYFCDKEGIFNRVILFADFTIQAYIFLFHLRHNWAVNYTDHPHRPPQESLISKAYATVHYELD